MIRALDLWLPGYLAQARRRRQEAGRPGPRLVLLAVADHFEPFWAGADRARALARVAAWEEGLPRVHAGLADSWGRAPRHDFFYPAEEYDPWVLDRLAALRERGLGEVEVHLHHQGETSAQLEDLLAAYVAKLAEVHGLLRRDPAGGGLTYGFIHGNWALDNSRPDGQWCGVNDELRVLARTGCFADFTLPAAPSRCQTRMVNSIYYATDDPARPKSHDRGRPAAKGRPPDGDLLLVQGVLALDWSRAKFGVLPRVENSDLAGHFPPSPGRARLWLAHAPRVAGAEEVLFVKLHCHGAPEKNHPAVLGPAWRETLEFLCSRYNDGRKWKLAFVTCWEMVQAIHALERGEDLAW
ncbi:MAG: hypothetical protein KQJ78_13355 [Deltaproteobacteria bacterium]|nr:hypothetical protein [Deltaproteobacteria bacterium]